jgi:carbamoyl-phosphate synthase large subunit
MSKAQPIRVLMTGAGAPGGPGILLALRQEPQIELTVADANPYASGKAIHSDFVQIPAASQPEFIGEMMRICREKQIQVLLPLVTRELELLSQSVTDFRDVGTSVVVSDADKLHMANDKALLMQTLITANIPVAECYTAHSGPEIEMFAKKLGYPQKKVCIKPALSNGSRGMRILDASAGSLASFFEQKPNNTHTTLESVLNIFKDAILPTMLVMEYLPGEEYTVDALLDNGQPLVILSRKRISMNNGISVAGEFENNKEIMDYASVVFKATGLHGPNGLQVKRSETGEFRILEINPRLQGSTTTALGMGINLPFLAVQQAIGIDVKSLIPEPRWGLRFTRYYADAWFSET